MQVVMLFTCVLWQTRKSLMKACSSSSDKLQLCVISSDLKSQKQKTQKLKFMPEIVEFYGSEM